MRDGDFAFYSAVENGSKQDVRMLPYSKQDPRFQNETTGKTALHAAVLIKHPGTASPLLVARLLMEGTNPNAADHEGKTPLHHAAILESHRYTVERANPNAVDHEGKKEAELPVIVALLLNAGADPNLVDHKGKTPLYYAAENGNIPTALVLLEHQKTTAEHQNTKDGTTPLHVAVLGNFLSMITILLCAKANPNAVDHEGKTPLHYAVTNGNIDSALMLLNAGADPNLPDRTIGETALHVAINKEPISSHKHMVDLLLKKKADPNAVDQQGKTPLHYAVTNGDINSALLLLDAGANPNLPDRITGKTALHVAINKEAISFCKYMVDLLLKKEADSNAVDQQGKTPLHYAASSRHFNIVALLLNAQADPNAVDQQGKTPLHYAVTNGDINSALLLLDAGANPNLPDRITGKTALHVAINKEEISFCKYMVDLLLKKEADPNAVDHEGKTPLHYAVTNEDFRGALLLIDALDITSWDSHNRERVLADAAKIGEAKTDPLYNTIKFFHIKNAGSGHESSIGVMPSDQVNPDDSYRTINSLLEFIRIAKTFKDPNAEVLDISWKLIFNYKGDVSKLKKRILNKDVTSGEPDLQTVITAITATPIPNYRQYLNNNYPSTLLRRTVFHRPSNTLGL